MLPDITVFDFETTGTDPRRDQVVELAAVRLVGGRRVACYDTLVRLRPGQEFSADAQRITGLTPADLAAGTDEATAFRMLRTLLRGSVLVAHNILFDYAFLHEGLLRAGGQAPTEDFLCTLTIGRNRRPAPHKLLSLVAAYGLPPRPAHRALDDVLMTVELVRAMAAEGPLTQYLNRAGWDSRFAHPSWWPAHAQLVKQRANRVKPAAVEMPVNAFRTT